jgi:hypothetical protein
MTPAAGHPEYIYVDEDRRLEIALNQYRRRGLLDKCIGRSEVR